MSKFIELHQHGKGQLINIDWIEEVREEKDGGCTIYFAFTCPGAIEQDHIKPDESYVTVRDRLEVVKEKTYAPAPVY